MFKVIRCGANYNVVIAISPPDAGPHTPGVMCYLYAARPSLGNYKPGVWHEISPGIAQRYCSSHASVIGYEEPPNWNFPSLEAIIHYINQKMHI